MNSVYLNDRSAISTSDYLVIEAISVEVSPSF